MLTWVTEHMHRGTTRPDQSRLHPQAHDRAPYRPYGLEMAADNPVTGGHYEIVVGRSLEDDWVDWFEDFEVEAEGRHTRLRGSVPDQAALHGALARLRDLGIPILAVHQLGETQDPGDMNPTKTERT